MKFNRSHVFAFVSLVVFVVLYLITDAPTVSAAETNITYIPLSPNLPLDIGTSITGLPDFLNKLFTATIVAGAILAVIMVAIGGFEYMTTDSVFSIGNAKDRIQGAIGGLFVILASILFLTTINPNIVNLKLFSPDGSSSSKSSATATKTVTNSDGSTTITYSDGTTAVKFSDGTKKVYDTTAGTVTYYDSSGNKTKTVNADGSVDTYSNGTQASGSGSGSTGAAATQTGTAPSGNNVDNGVSFCSGSSGINCTITNDSDTETNNETGGVLPDENHWGNMPDNNETGGVLPDENHWGNMPDNNETGGYDPSQS